MSRTRGRRGFSLIEALVSVALAGGGLAALVTAIGGAERAEARLLRAEKLQRLAHQKLEEAVSIQEFNEQSGDFSDSGEPDVRWELTFDTTSVESLNHVTVTATFGDGDTQAQTVETLLYIPPTNTEARPRP